MRCNRKTSGFAVTPRKKNGGLFDITEILQLRRNTIINRLIRLFFHRLREFSLIYNFYEFGFLISNLPFTALSAALNEKLL